MSPEFILEKCVIRLRLQSAFIYYSTHKKKLFESIYHRNKKTRQTILYGGVLIMSEEPHSQG